MLGATVDDSDVYKVFRPLKMSKTACTAFEYVILVCFLPFKFKLKDARFGSMYNLMNIQCPPHVKTHLMDTVLHRPQLNTVLHLTHLDNKCLKDHVIS